MQQRFTAQAGAAFVHPIVFCRVWRGVPFPSVQTIAQAAAPWYCMIIFPVHAFNDADGDDRHSTSCNVEPEQETPQCLPALPQLVPRLH
jgi:hypothetical protein